MSGRGAMRERGAIYVLTGERGSGKTYICTQVVADARARGLDVAGLLTGRSGPEPGDPREVVDLRSGDARLFGVQSVGEEPTSWSVPERSSGDATDASPDSAAGSSHSDPLTPGWEYRSDVFAWGDQVLSRATPCDLLVVDEVGPLELQGGRGWVKALEVLRKHDFAAALVVCRPELLDELEQSLGEAPAHVFEAQLATADALAATIAAEILG